MDSIFVESDYRGLGIGDALMKRALKRLDDLSAKTKKVVVAGGNEEIFDFYRRYGFYPRYHLLEQVIEKG